jgi:hypothetical protein
MPELYGRDSGIFLLTAHPSIHDIYCQFCFKYHLAGIRKRHERSERLSDGFSSTVHNICAWSRIWTPDCSTNERNTWKTIDLLFFTSHCHVVFHEMWAQSQHSEPRYSPGMCLSVDVTFSVLATPHLPHRSEHLLTFSSSSLRDSLQVQVCHLAQGA